MRKSKSNTAIRKELEVKKKELRDAYLSAKEDEGQIEANERLGESL